MNKDVKLLLKIIGICLIVTSILVVTFIIFLSLNKPDPCWNKWVMSGSPGVAIINFSNNISEQKIEGILRPLNPINFSFDIYTFHLPKEDTNYTCTYDWIGCYTGATGNFIAYLNKDKNISSFVSDYEYITLIVNNKVYDENHIINLINSYNYKINVKSEDLEVKKGYYGFYVSYPGTDTAKYICKNLDENPDVNSIEIITIFA